MIMSDSSLERSFWGEYYLIFFTSIEQNGPMAVFDNLCHWMKNILLDNLLSEKYFLTIIEQLLFFGKMIFIVCEQKNRQKNTNMKL